MAAQFRRSRKGTVSITLGEAETRIVRHVLAEMLELLGPGEQGEGEADPLAAAVGIGTSTAPPVDPALARLFPDGYTDDSDASADFRRYTEAGLRESKREAVRTALASLGEAGERTELTPEQADAWLRALNDARLVLGERLGVTENWDEQVESLDDDDPLLGLFWVYDRLTMLQESLVQALS